MRTRGCGDVRLDRVAQAAQGIRLSSAACTSSKAHNSHTPSRAALGAMPPAPESKGKGAASPQAQAQAIECVGGCACVCALP